MTYLPAQPILDWIEARGGLARVLGVEPNGNHVGQAPGACGGHPRSQYPDYRKWHKTVQRMSRSGRVSVWQADRLCIGLLGTNPALVFGQVWWDAIPDDEEGAA